MHVENYDSHNSHKYEEDLVITVVFITFLTSYAAND